MNLLLAAAAASALSSAVIKSDTNDREVWDIWQRGVMACFEEQNQPGVSYPWSPTFAKASSMLVWDYAHEGKRWRDADGKKHTVQVTISDWEIWKRKIVLSNSKFINDAPCMLNWMNRHMGERV